MILKHLIVPIFVFTSILGFTQTWNQMGQDIQGLVAEASDGGSVSLSGNGNTIAIGAPSEGITGGEGYVRIFDWNGTSWTQRGSTIIGGWFTWFGECVSISNDGNTVAIGAPDAYYAEVYEWTGSAWTQKGSTIPADAFSVALDASGNILVLNKFNATPGQDVVRIYFFDGLDWMLMNEIYGEEPNENMGLSLTLSKDGNLMAYASPSNTGGTTSGGSARIYTTGGGMVGSEINGQLNNALGSSPSGTALSTDGSGTVFAVGNLRKNSYSGEVTIYEYTTDWTPKGAPISGVGETGASVSLNTAGDKIAIGNHTRNISGSAFTFEWNGTAWVQYGQEIFGDNPNDGFGGSVSMSPDGTTIAVGAHANDNAGTDSGHTRIYRYCQPTTSSISPIACASYTTPSGDETYTTAGIYYDTILNTNGCDSIITINLSIGNNTGADVMTVCDTYTWIDGITYTSSTNSPTWTFVNNAGCDSIVTLDLTITNSTTGTDAITACDNYTWVDGNTYFSSTNSPAWTVQNNTGCDSIVTLDLTITNSTTGTDVITACNSYTWLDGNTYATSTNSPTWTVANNAGCDSIITLDLTINNVDEAAILLDELTISAAVSGVQYQWLDCDDNYAILAGEANQTFSATANGNYAVQVTDNNCTDTSSCLSIQSVGMVENGLGNALNIYPNPTQGTFEVQLGEAYQTIEASITDLSGKMISVHSFKNAERFTLNIDHAAGLYILTVNSETKKSRVKIIKE